MGTGVWQVGGQCEERGAGGGATYQRQPRSEMLMITAAQPHRRHRAPHRLSAAVHRGQSEGRRPAVVAGWLDSGHLVRRVASRPLPLPLPPQPKPPPSPLCFASTPPRPHRGKARAYLVSLRRATRTCLPSPFMKSFTDVISVVHILEKIAAMIGAGETRGQGMP